ARAAAVITSDHVASAAVADTTLGDVMTTSVIDVRPTRIAPERGGVHAADPRSLVGEARHADGVEQLGAQARPGIARNGDVIHVVECDARFGQAITDSRGRKSRCVLHPVEPLLLHGRDQATITDDRTGGVTLVGVDAENVHAGTLPVPRRSTRMSGGRSQP